MTDFEGRVSQANGRLRASSVGVVIEVRGGKLNLRSTLPPRPDSQRTESYQQRIPLPYRANPAGLKLAEQEARKVSALVACKEFSWEPYLKQAKSTPQVVGDWVEAFHANYLLEGGTEDTWQGDYWKILKRLPSDQALTMDLVHGLVLGTTPNSKTRQRTCMAVGALARFAQMDYNPSPYRGNYGPDAVDPCDLPNDRTIAEWFHKIKNPGWRWVYGMMATYGLRNHEVFRLDFEQIKAGNDVVSVLKPTKTGSRKVWAYYPEWWEDFKLQEVQLPNVNLDRSNEKVGRSVTEYFSGLGLPFFPYALRHCWAVRTLVLGVPYEIAAKQMGHSVEVHERTYHRWIKDDVHQQVHDAVRNRSDRPKAPSVLRP